MKRIVALLLAMVMVLGLVACGGGGGNGDKVSLLGRSLRLEARLLSRGADGLES